LERIEKKGCLFEGFYDIIHIDEKEKFSGEGPEG